MLKNLRNSVQISNNFFLYDELYRLKDILISLQGRERNIELENILVTIERKRKTFIDHDENFNFCF